MRLPDEICHSRSLADVICNNSSDPSDTLLSKISSRVILSPTDASVGEVESFPDEYLKLVYIGSHPPHKLILKFDAPILVLRNIDPNGLCDGTRQICKSLSRNIIQVEIATNPNSEKKALILRIALISDSDQAGVEFRRRQFPVRLAFAMTINKSKVKHSTKLACVFCHLCSVMANCMFQYQELNGQRILRFY